ncbi:hypothetical protein MATR_25710 [Marivirga tractuosa]|nr:hypothetical protein MATR_25710 [Marivirga tractuosa]
MSISFIHLNLTVKNPLNSNALISRTLTEILSYKNKHKHMKCLIKSQYYRILAN